MGTASAFQIVLDLARQNIIEHDDLPDEHARQVEACNVIEDLAVNQFGDDSPNELRILTMFKQYGYEDPKTHKWIVVEPETQLLQALVLLLLAVGAVALLIHFL